MKKTKQKGDVSMRNQSCVTCHMSCVMCYMCSVTCHLSLTLTATPKDPLFANSPNMHSKLICKDPKTNKNYLNTQNIKTDSNYFFFQLANISDMLVVKESPESPVQREAGFPGGDTQHSTDIATYRQ